MVSRLHQHGSKYFAHRPPPPLTLGSKGRNSTFSGHGHVAYQIKRNHECRNMVANTFPADPAPSPHPEVKIHFFLEHGHVAYQIEGNHECSSMVEIILPPSQPPSTLGVGSKFDCFQNMVMLHIKLKGIANAATW